MTNSQSPDRAALADELIQHMVDRFLGWKLPDSFSPDGGIIFHRFGNFNTPREYKNQPSGTNLFDANQATAMVRYMLEGSPSPYSGARKAKSASPCLNCDDPSDELFCGTCREMGCSIPTTLPRDAEQETIERIDTMVARVYFNAWSGAIAVTEDGKQWRLSADEIKNALNAQAIRALPSIPSREGVEREAIKSHVYTPDYQAMGDCRVCGHGQNQPWHLYSSSPTSVMPDEEKQK